MVTFTRSSGLGIRRKVNLCLAICDEASHDLAIAPKQTDKNGGTLNSAFHSPLSVFNSSFPIKKGGIATVFFLLFFIGKAVEIVVRIFFRFLEGFIPLLLLAGRSVAAAVFLLFILLGGLLRLRL